MHFKSFQRISPQFSASDCRYHFLGSTMCCQPQELQLLNSHKSDVTCCDFGFDSRLATGSGDKSIMLWNWQPGLGFVEVEHSPLKGHKYGVTSVSFSPQATMLASSSIDGTTVLWGARNGKQISKFQQVNGVGVRVCRFSKDSLKLATGGDNGVVCIWDLVQKTLIRTIQEHEDTVHGLDFSPDSRLLVTSCNQGLLKLYNATGFGESSAIVECLISLDDAHDLGVLFCDFSNEPIVDEADGCSWYLLATCGNDSSLRQWKVRSAGSPTDCEPIQSSFNISSAHSSAITCVRYNLQGNLLASTSLDRSVKLWNTSGACVQTLEGHSRYVNCVCFSRDGAILCTGSNDKTVKVWNMRDESLTLDSELVKPCVAFSHFGRGDLEGISAIQEEDLNTFIVKPENNNNNEVQLLQTIKGLHRAAINAIEFSPGGKLLGTASGDKCVKLLRCEEDKDWYLDSKSILTGTHRYQVNSLNFPEDDILISCSLDGTIAMWNTSSDENRPIHILSRNFAGARCVSVALGYLLAAYDDGAAALWTINPPSPTPIVVYPEHANAATCCSLSKDCKLACCASHNGDFKIYSAQTLSLEPIMVQDCAHDLGVQAMDFARGLQDLPMDVDDGFSCYLLATCGNDCLARIWKILLQNVAGQQIWSHSEWKVLGGHGSSVTNIRFPTSGAEKVCTTSTDKQARIWSVHLGTCLHVLEHSSLVTCCAFSSKGSLLATACLNGELNLWKLPQDDPRNATLDAVSQRPASPCLITLMDQEDPRPVVSLPRVQSASTPHHLLCPLTHVLMRRPVACSDGFTYERAAIQEWFISGGHSVSPMTGQPLLNSVLNPNRSLELSIKEYLFNRHQPQDNAAQEQSLIDFD